MRVASTPDKTRSLVCAVTNLLLGQTALFTQVDTACLLSSLSFFPRLPPLTGCPPCQWTSAEPRPTTTSCWFEVNHEFPAHSNHYAHPSSLVGYQSNGYANSYPAASCDNDHYGRDTSVTYQQNPYTSDFWSPTPEHEPSSTPPFFGHHNATNQLPAPTVYNNTLSLQDKEPLEPILSFTVRVQRLSLVPAPVEGCDPPPEAIVDHGITIVPRAACTFPPGSVKSNNTVPTLEDSSTESSTSHLSTTCQQFTSAFSSHSIFQHLVCQLRATNIKPLNSTTSVGHSEPPQRGF